MIVRIRSIETHKEWLLPLLSKQERITANGFPVYKRTLEYIAGRMVVKLCLRHLISADYRQISIERGSMGQPILRIDGAPAEDISIAISHGGDYVYCGAALGTKIGLDVEPISGKLYELRKIWAVPEEWRKIISENYNPEIHDANLTRLWTAKESLAKFLDVGLDHVFKRARLESLASDHVKLNYTNGRTHFSIQCETFLHRGHIFAFLCAPLH